MGIWAFPANVAIFFLVVTCTSVEKLCTNLLIGCWSFEERFFEVVVDAHFVVDVAAVVFVFVVAYEVDVV